MPKGPAFVQQPDILYCPHKSGGNAQPYEIKWHKNHMIYPTELTKFVHNWFTGQTYFLFTKYGCVSSPMSTLQLHEFETREKHSGIFGAYT